jgi:hypothetical protein
MIAGSLSEMWLRFGKHGLRLVFTLGVRLATAA